MKHAILRSLSAILVSHRHSNTTVRNPNESLPHHYVSHFSFSRFPRSPPFSLVQKKSVILCTYSLKEKGNATHSNLPTSSYRFPSCLLAYARALTPLLLHLPTSLATSAAAQVQTVMSLPKYASPQHILISSIANYKI